MKYANLELGYYVGKHFVEADYYQQYQRKLQIGVLELTSSEKMDKTSGLPATYVRAIVRIINTMLPCIVIDQKIEAIVSLSHIFFLLEKLYEPKNEVPTR